MIMTLKTKEESESNYFWNDIRITKEEYDLRCKHHQEWTLETERKQAQEQKLETPKKATRKKN